MYIGPKSRTERPRKIKIGTEVAHVKRDSDTTFKVKRSRSPGRFTQRGLNARGRCSGDRENVLGVGNYCYVASARRRARHWGAHGRRRGRSISCRTPSAVEVLLDAEKVRPGVYFCWVDVRSGFRPV